MPQSQARLAPTQYTFAPASKQITFAGVPGFALDGLIEVLHVASGNVLYDAYDPALGGTVSGSTVTLSFDTTGTYTPPGGAATAYASTDALRIIYNDQTRDDLVLVFNPTTTGVIPGSTLPIKSYMQAIGEVISSTDINITVEFSIDKVNWKTGSTSILGRLPNLHGNQGDTNLNQGTPYNTRVYDLTAFAWIRLNVTSMSAGSPVVNLLLKTAPAPTRDVFITGGGNLTISLGSSTAAIGYLNVGVNYQEALRSTLAANGVRTGSSRDTLFNPLTYNRFGALAVSDQPGTLQIQFSNDNTNWIPATPQVAVQANTPLDIAVPIRARYCRAVYVNGSTATGATAFTLLTSFLSA